MKKLYTYIFRFTLFVCLSIVSQIPTFEKNDDHDNYEQIMFDWSRMWAEIMSLVKEKHYKITNAKKSMAKALDAFLNDLDPHSNFLDTKTYESMTQTISGNFDGIGIVIDNTRKSKDHFLTVIEAISCGPADKAGIKQYDKIIEIEGQSLGDMTTEHATSLLKGPRDTCVHIKVLREGQTDLLSFTITREVIKDHLSFNFYIKNHHIYYLSLSMFTHNAAQQLEKLLNKTNEKNIKGIILDLRNNSGGLLNSAIDIAGFFLDKGSSVVTTKDKDHNEIQKYCTLRNPLNISKIPIFILINNFTASAAEILAGALHIHAQSHKQKNPLLVFLVGTTSFGKGSVQEVIPVGNNCAIKLTTALYFLPENIPVQAEGIIPDFVVPKSLPVTEQMNWFTDTYGRENALENCIRLEKKTQEIKKNESPVTDRWQERVKNMLQTDNQLKEAINLITTLDNGRIATPHLIKNRETALHFLKKNYINYDTLEVEELKI